MDVCACVCFFSGSLNVKELCKRSFGHADLPGNRTVKCFIPCIGAKSNQPVLKLYVSNIFVSPQNSRRGKIPHFDGISILFINYQWVETTKIRRDAVKRSCDLDKAKYISKYA